MVKKAVSQALPPQNLPIFFLIRSKVTKHMPMANKNMKIATFIALLHLLCGYYCNYSLLQQISALLHKAATL